MKICLINNLYYPYQRGGAERIVELITEELLASGHQVTIITTRPRKSRKLEEEKQNRGNFKIYYLPSAYYNLKKIHPALRLIWHFWNLFNLVNYQRLKNILGNEEPDIVISHNLMGLGFLTPWAIKGLAKPWIHTLHDIQLIYPLGLMYYGQEKKIDIFPARIYRALTRKLFSSPTLIISPSRWLIETHQKYNFFKKSKTAVQLNPSVANHKPFGENGEDDIRQGKDIFTILYVGQLEQHKGIDLLVDAFLELAPSVATPLRLKIIGDGDSLESIKIKIKKNPGTAIELLGRQPAKTVLNFMKRAQLLIVPSLCYENSPTVIYEAAANNLPTLSADIGGAGELTTASGGIVFKPGDKQDLLKKIKFCLDNYQTIKNNLRPETIIKSNYTKNLLDLLRS